MRWLTKARRYVAPSSKLVMLFFCFANLFNYLDRGIIPGASSEFDTFIQGTHELEGTESADMYLGFLQSSYIVGYSLASILFGNLIHSQPAFQLVGYGLLVWCAAAVLAGLSRGAESFTMLLLARMLSGVGEASFQVVATPYIQDHAGDSQGAWLGLYYTAIPLGTAIGYVYGASFAHSPLTWAGAFIFEAFFMAPLALFCFIVPDEQPAERPVASQSASTAPPALQPTEYEDDARHIDALPLAVPVRPAAPTPAAPLGLFDEMRLVLRIRIFWLVALGYAGYTATIMGFATFGPAFVMGLGFFDDEQNASLTFGVLVSVAGIVGTPLGGFLLDKGKKRIEAREAEFYAPSSAPGGEAVVRTSQVPQSVRSMALTQVVCLVSVGAVLNICVVSVMDKVLFLFLMGLGITLLMAPTAGMNLSLLESVPQENRSLAIGIGTLIMHVFGDVPSPIVIGAIKGALAPHCTPRGEDAKIPDECSEEQDGLRATLYILSFWIVWALIGFGAALYASRGGDQEVAIAKQLASSGFASSGDPEEAPFVSGVFGQGGAEASRVSFGLAHNDDRAASPERADLDAPLLSPKYEDG